jgi:glycosyltransferase involved in cell wall biosynthesis
MDLSMVVPIKDERDNLSGLHERITAALAPVGRSYEIILVDDGSTDDSYPVLQALAARDHHVKVVRLQRNYGQSAALQAGIDWSTGAILVTLDGDLQNDPADIPMMLDKLQEGYDAVLGLRAKRQDHLFIRKIPSLMGNWLIRKVTGVQVHDLGCTLRAMRREVAEAIPLYGEMHRFISVLAQQSGARMLQVPVRHHPRTAGKTKYTLSRSFRVILDLITVKFLHSYLTRPMHMMGSAGLVAIALSMASVVGTVWMKVQGGTDMTGNPLLLLSVLMAVVGMQFISMGLIGELMTRTYFESQGKRAYAVRNTINIDETSRRRTPLAA